MQLNDVIKSIGWYRAFVALPIQTDTTKKCTDTDTGIGIGASLVKGIDSLLILHSWCEEIRLANESIQQKRF